MRKRDQVRLVGGKSDAHLLADDLAEKRTRHELLDGQPADRDHKIWSKDPNFGLEPVALRTPVDALLRLMQQPVDTRVAALAQEISVVQVRTRP